MARADEKQVQRIEPLVRRVEALPDSGAREDALQLMQCILDLHGSGIERMMEIVFESAPSGEGLVRGSRPIPWWRTCFCSTGFIPTIWRRELHRRSQNSRMLRSSWARSTILFTSASPAEVKKA